MGAIQPNWDAQFISKCFKTAVGEIVKVKVSMNFEFPRKAIGYAMVEFTSHSAARRTKDSLHSKHIPGTNVLFVLKWAERNKKKISNIRGDIPRTTSRFSFQLFVVTFTREIPL